MTELTKQVYINSGTYIIGGVETILSGVEAFQHLIDDGSLTAGDGVTITYDKNAQYFAEEPGTAFPVSDVKLGNVSIVVDGVAYISVAASADITAKTSANKMLTPSNIDEIIKEGLTNNQLTWDNAAKAAARSLIGAGIVDDVKINGVSIVTSGVANIPIASHGIAGAFLTSGSAGLLIGSSGNVSVYCASDAFIEAKTNQYRAIVPSNLDKAIMEGLGNNSLTWSDAYKSNARTLIGAADADDVLAQTVFSCEMSDGTTKTLTLNGTLV